MPKYELTGTVRLLHDIQTFSSGFAKREFVVETDGKYPQLIKMECVKDNVAKLDGISPGDVVNVSFDVRGNEYNGKHYVQLVAWSVKATGEKEQPDQNSRRNQYGGTDRTPAEAMPSRHQQQKQDGYQRDNGGSEPDDQDIPFQRKPAPFQP